MISSIFILTATGDVLLEKHNRKPLSRSVLDPLFEILGKVASVEEVAPVIHGAKHWLVSITRSGLVYSAAVPGESQVLLLLEFLHRMVDMIEAYIGTDISEKKLNANTVLVYQILEEMCDNGFPLTTEENLLMETIMKPTLINKALKTIGQKKGVTENLPGSQLSMTHWRRSNVKYANNEFLINAMESLYAIVDKSGHVIYTEISGALECKCKLSGMPDLTLSFQNAGAMEDISLHPSVRIARWQNEKVMSFVPPDGDFVLARYMCTTGVNLPVSVLPSVTYGGAPGSASVGPGKLSIKVEHKHGYQPENLTLKMVFHKSVSSITANAPVGSVAYDDVTKTLTWDLKKLSDKDMILTGSIHLVDNIVPDGTPPVLVSMKVPVALSGVKVAKLDIHNVSYKPFKGVKYFTVAGDYQVRT